MTVEKHILTQEEINERKAISYLKGMIIAYGIENGLKWKSNREPSEAFQAGFDSKSHADITSVHILYNRLRHNRPHTFSVENDQEILENSFYINILKEKIMSFAGISDLWEENK